MKKLILVLGLMLVVPVLKVGAAANCGAFTCSCQNNQECRALDKCSAIAECKNGTCKAYYDSTLGWIACGV